MFQIRKSWTKFHFVTFVSNVVRGLAINLVSTWGYNSRHVFCFLTFSRNVITSRFLLSISRFGVHCIPRSVIVECVPVHAYLSSFHFQVYASIVVVNLAFRIPITFFAFKLRKYDSIYTIVQLCFQHQCICMCVNI